MNKAFSFLCLLFLSLSVWGFDDKTRVAFYYGSPVLQELHAFNVVVVHPEGDISPQEFNTPNSQLYAYVSIGELDPEATKGKQISAAWRIGKNAAWKSAVMDMKNPQWRDFLLNEVIAPLWKKGYRGFFLDTLDSYQLLKLTPEGKKQQEDGIVEVIQSIKKSYPQAQIIANRGFEFLDRIHSDIVALAAESLFEEWEPNKKVYQPVKEEERTSLLSELKKAHENYHLPIIVIDYVPPAQRDKARETAQKIKKLGYIPWVSDPEMETLGIGSVEVMPRKVLVILGDVFDWYDYDKIAFPLEYMGYIPVFQWTLSDFPENSLNGEYAGIIAWLGKAVISHHAAFQKWINRQLTQGIPIVFLENFGFSDSALFKKLGIQMDQSIPPVGKMTITADKMVGYEITPKPNLISFLPLKIKEGEALVKIKAENGQEQVAAAITPWGGYALDPFNIINLPNGHAKWVMNPFDFFRRALRLPQFPVPDTTTENGRRILTIHLDGDAFISQVPWLNDEYAGELLFREIFSKYKLPTTVSVIQREFELIKPAEDVYQRLVKTAQKTFALPWVHIATHTYSHPLDWQKLVEGQPNTKWLSYPSKNYLFSYEKEIKGSTDFINQQLAPKDKKVTTVFWSGDADVKEKPLRLAYEYKLKNVNGFANVYTHAFNSLTDLSGYGRYIGKYFQVYSPIPNEFQYTYGWTPPYFYAFEQAIHTFELTDKPHRYKPISIYYHFYSAVEQSSFRALKRVYEWAISVPTTPLFIEDYIDKVHGFYSTVIAKGDDSLWLIVNNGALSEMRSPQDLGFPDLAKSKNVVGFSSHNKDYYIHLGPQTETWLGFTKNPPTQPYLQEANAKVTQWDVSPDQKSIRASLEGYVPLNFKFANLKNCELKQQFQKLNSEDGSKNGQFEIRCIK